MSNANVATGSLIPLNCGKDNIFELFIAVIIDHSNNLCISRIILQKKVFPEPLAPYIKETLLKLISLHANSFFTNSFFPESICVVNSTLFANEAKFSTDRYFKMILFIVFPPVK